MYNKYMGFSIAIIYVYICIYIYKTILYIYIYIYIYIYNIYIYIYVTFGVYIWFPANSVVSVWYSGPLWWVRQQRYLDSLVNIERQTLRAPSGTRVLLGRSW